MLKVHGKLVLEFDRGKLGTAFFIDDLLFAIYDLRNTIWNLRSSAVKLFFKIDYR